MFPGALLADRERQYKYPSRGPMNEEESPTVGPTLGALNVLRGGMSHSKFGGCQLSAAVLFYGVGIPRLNAHTNRLRNVRDEKRMLLLSEHIENGLYLSVIAGSLNRRVNTLDSLAFFAVDSPVAEQIKSYAPKTIEFHRASHF